MTTFKCSAFKKGLSLSHLAVVSWLRFDMVFPESRSIFLKLLKHARGGLTYQLQTGEKKCKIHQKGEFSIHPSDAAR